MEGKGEVEVEGRRGGRDGKIHEPQLYSLDPTLGVF